MKRLEEIMVEYAREKGGGLPLTPQEMCNAVVLWVQEKLLAEVKENFPAIEGYNGVEVAYNEETNHYLITADNDYIKALFTAEVLANLIEGSDTIVADINEAGDKIELHLDGEVVNKLSRALLTPVQNPSEVELVAIGTDGSQINIPISEVVGGGGGGSAKLYEHRIQFTFNNFVRNVTMWVNVITSRAEPYSNLNDPIFSVFRPAVGFNFVEDITQAVPFQYTEDGLVVDTAYPPNTELTNFNDTVIEL